MTDLQKCSTTVEVVPGLPGDHDDRRLECADKVEERKGRRQICASNQVTDGNECSSVSVYSEVRPNVGFEPNVTGDTRAFPRLTARLANCTTV